MVATDAPKADDQITAAHKELHTLAAQMQQFLVLNDFPVWAPEVLPDEGASQSVTCLRQLDGLLSRRLGIVGLEGAGKSTLINAVFGRAVVPTDADQPGTAIPTYIYASSDSSARYAIETKDGEIHNSADYEELSSYVLQRHNPNNQKQIKHASISQPCPHLPPGLCLVDLPGSGGMSSSFRESALASLDYVNRVILVVQDRNAGPALELAHDIINRGVEITAVAVNLQMSKLVDPKSLQPLPENEARDHIAATRDYVKRIFLNELPQLKAKCEFFAFHFPSMQSLSIAPEAVHWIPSQIEEIYRFSDWFVGCNGNAAMIARLQEVTEDITTKLTQSTDQILIVRERVDGLLKSDPIIQEQVRQELEKRRSVVRDEWVADTDSGRVRAAKLKAWGDFEPSVIRLKAELQRLRQSTRSGLPDNWWSQNRELKSEISERLNRGLSTASDRLNRRATKVLQNFTDSARQVAYEIAAADHARAPIDVGPFPMTAIESTSIWTPPSIVSERQSLAEYDSAKVIERLLDELAVAEMSITLDQGGSLDERFDGELSRIAFNIESELQRRYDDVIRVLCGGRSQALEQLQQNLDQRFAKLKELDASAASLKRRITSIELSEEKHLIHLQAARERMRELSNSRSQRSVPGSESILGASFTSLQSTQVSGRPAIWNRLFQRLSGLFGYRIT